MTGSQPQKSAFSVRGAILVDFFLFRNALQNLLRKNIEKNAKIEDFGLPKPSPNPPEMPPKSKVPKNCDLSLFFLYLFDIFLSRFS